jgi:hypothetical protein
MRIWTAPFGVLLALLPSSIGLAQPTATTFEVGQPFPAIVLPSLEGGKPMAVSDLRGKKLVLHIFASW